MKQTEEVKKLKKLLKEKDLKIKELYSLTKTLGIYKLLKLVFKQRSVYLFTDLYGNYLLIASKNKKEAINFSKRQENESGKDWEFTEKIQGLIYNTSENIKVIFKTS